MASTEVERPGSIEIPGSEQPSSVDDPEQLLKVELAEVTSSATEQRTEKGPKQKKERCPEKKRANANNNNQQQSNQHNRRFRHDYFKSGRKRSYSFNGGGKFGPPYKRWKFDLIVPPTKFLLGGNICDPLNLNSLQDEEINRAMNAVTPHSSPLPTPKHRKEVIEVLIPPNIHDPLNLSAPDDDPNYERNLISPKKKRPRHRRRKSSSAAIIATVTTAAQVAETSAAVECAENKSSAETPESTEKMKKPEDPAHQDKKQLRRSGSDIRTNDRRSRRAVDDKIVSPVIPQPGAWKRPPPIYNRNLSWDIPRNKRNRRQRNKNKNQPQDPPVFNPNNTKFQYGNYNRYYGYRNPDQSIDIRMKCFRKDMFYGKEVLDIGCNVGHVTLNIARNLGPKRIVGIDIDKQLLNAARNNLKHYASCNPIDSNEKYPVSMPILYGPLEIPLPVGSDRFKFPHNVSFVYGNYVLETDVLLTMEKPQFDVILCLSVTKWFHLNFGDEGLKRSFRRMHAQLKPGGKLILEAQPWNSYKSKKKLTETIYKHYNSIQFQPDKFADYLLSSEVGFTKCEVLGAPQHKAKGFARPIHMFTKAELPHHSPSETVPSTACGDAALPTETSVIRPDIVHPLMDAEEWVYAAPLPRLDDDSSPEVMQPPFDSPEDQEFVHREEQDLVEESNELLYGNVNEYDQHNDEASTSSEKPSDTPRNADTPLDPERVLEDVYSVSVDPSNQCPAQSDHEPDTGISSSDIKSETPDESDKDEDSCGCSKAKKAKLADV